jgi:hypothetical protein
VNTLAKRVTGVIRLIRLIRGQAMLSFYPFVGEFSDQSRIGGSISVVSGSRRRRRAGERSHEQLARDERGPGVRVRVCAPESLAKLKGIIYGTVLIVALMYVFVGSRDVCMCQSENHSVTRVTRRLG